MAEEELIVVESNEDRIDVFDEPTEAEELSAVVEESETGEVETEVEAEVETTEDETEVETEAAPASQKDETSGLKAALAAERAKRQEAERQLQAKVEVPDPFDDPDGYEAHVAQQYQNKRINDSRDDMIDNTADFLEKEAVFMSLVMDTEGKVTDASLQGKFLAAKNPARFAYNHANEHLKLESLKSIDLDKERAAAKEAGRLEAIEEMKKAGKLSANYVPDLTRATSAGSNSVKKESSVENPEDLFEDDSW